MTTALVTYLQFSSSTREAMEFYHSVFGGDLDIATFDDFGMPVGEGEGASSCTRACAPRAGLS